MQNSTRLGNPWLKLFEEGAGIKGLKQTTMEINIFFYIAISDFDIFRSNYIRFEIEIINIFLHLSQKHVNLIFKSS